MNISKLIRKIFIKKTAHKKVPTRNVTPKDCELLNTLQQGDIILYRFRGKKDFAGSFTAEFTSSPYVHAAIHMFDGYEISANLDGVGFTDVYKMNVDSNRDVDIFRLKGGLTREQRLIIFSKVYQSMVVEYDYIGLFLLPFLKGKAAVQFSGNNAYICSEHVAWCYKNAGIDLIKDRPEAIEAPVDIGVSDVLEYLGTFSKGKKVQGKHRNAFRRGEKNTLSKLTKKFIGLFSNKDEFYKGISLNKTLLAGEINEIVPELADKNKAKK